MLGRVALGFVSVVAAVAVTTVAGPAPAQVDCDGGLSTPEAALPVGFVQPPPWAWAIGVTVDGFDVACGDRVVLRATPLEVAPAAWSSSGTRASGTFNFDYVGGPVKNRTVCDEGCPYVRAEPVDTDVAILGGRGVVTVPTEIGPGLVQISVRSERDGEVIGFTPTRTLMLTSADLARADQDARRAMNARADDAESSGDDRKVERLRALVASSRHFLHYEDIEDGREHLVAVFGDMVSADQVAISVPGFNTAADEGYELEDNCLPPGTGEGEDTSARGPCVVSKAWMFNAERLWRRSAGIEEEDRTAVIAYMGYDAPGYRGVASFDTAFAGADNLAEDLDDWGLTGDGADRLVFVGHSYGSLTVALAAGQGDMAARDMVILGSPGVGVDMSSRPSRRNTRGSTEPCPAYPGVSCFESIDDGHVWTARFSNDPVPKQFRNFGEGPTSARFGAHQFHTAPPQCNRALGGFSPITLGCHSKYFNWGQRSLDNIARVVIGRYSVLENGDHLVDDDGGRVPPNAPNSGARRWPDVPDLIAAVDASGANNTCSPIDLDDIVADATCVAAAAADVDGDGTDDERIVAARTGPDTGVTCFILGPQLSRCSDLRNVDPDGTLDITEIADLDGDNGQDAIVRVGFGANTAVHDIITFDGADLVVPDVPIVVGGGILHYSGYSCADADGDGAPDLVLTGWSATTEGGSYDAYTTSADVYRWDGKDLIATWALEGRATGGPPAAEADPHGDAGCGPRGFDGITDGLPAPPATPEEAVEQFLDAWAAGDERAMRAVAAASADSSVDPVVRALMYPPGETATVDGRCTTFTVTEPDRTLASCPATTPVGSFGSLEIEQVGEPGGPKVSLLAFGGE